MTTATKSIADTSIQFFIRILFLIIPRILKMAKNKINLGITLTCGPENSADKGFFPPFFKYTILYFRIIQNIMDMIEVIVL